MIPSLSALSLAEPEPTAGTPYDRIKSLVIELADPKKRPKTPANGGDLPNWWKQPLTVMNNAQLVQLYEARKAESLKVAEKRGSNKLIKESDAWNQNRRVLMRQLVEKADEMRREASQRNRAEDDALSGIDYFENLQERGAQRRQMEAQQRMRQEAEALRARAASDSAEKQRQRERDAQRRQMEQQERMRREVESLPQLPLENQQARGKSRAPFLMNPRNRNERVEMQREADAAELEDRRRALVKEAEEDEERQQRYTRLVQSGGESPKEAPQRAAAQQDQAEPTREDMKKTVADLVPLLQTRVAEAENAKARAEAAVKQNPGDRSRFEFMSRDDQLRLARELLNQWNTLFYVLDAKTGDVANDTKNYLKKLLQEVIEGQNGRVTHLGREVAIEGENFYIETKDLTVQEQALIAKIESGQASLEEVRLRDATLLRVRDDVMRERRIKENDQESERLLMQIMSTGNFERIKQEKKLDPGAEERELLRFLSREEAEKAIDRFAQRELTRIAERDVPSWRRAAEWREAKLNGFRMRKRALESERETLAYMQQRLGMLSPKKGNA